MKHRIVAGRTIAHRYDITCSCGTRVETHTAADLVRWLVQHRGPRSTVDLQLRHVHTGEIRAQRAGVLGHLADRILHSPEPPATGHWEPIR